MLRLNSYLFLRLSLLFDFYSTISMRWPRTISYEIYSFADRDHSHAESPVWDHENQTLYWVDVLSTNIYGLDYRTCRLKIQHVDCREINIVLPVANSSNLLIGADSSLFLTDWSKMNAPLNEIAIFDDHASGHILNEGKVDAKGRFWGGTKGLQEGNKVVPHKGSFYSLEVPSFQPVLKFSKVTVSNGLTWSLNNSVLYYIDSPNRKIEAFDNDLDTGTISNRRTIIDLADDVSNKEAIPDGMTIDRDDKLWVALMFGGKVIRIDPDKRKIIAVYKFPTPKVTSVMWAGPKMEDLVVTTSRRNSDTLSLVRYPLSGSIFVLKNLGTGGVPTLKFVINK